MRAWQVYIIISTAEQPVAVPGCGGLYLCYRTVLYLKHDLLMNLVVVESEELVVPSFLFAL